MEKVLCKGDVVYNGTREYRILGEPVMNQDKLNWHVLVAEMNVPGDARRFMKYTLKDNVAAYLPLKRESKFRISYPYIERIYDYFETSQPLGKEAAFLIAEYEDGMDLREFYGLEGRPGEDTPDQELRYFAYMLQLLYAADNYNSYNRSDPLVHRDLKPENIMVSRDGSRVKIVDFDWAHTDRRDRITRQLSLASQKTGGTPGYMDPRAEYHYVSDIQADIYSLAMVFLFLLSGRDYIRDDEIYLYTEPERWELAHRLQVSRLKEQYRQERYRGLHDIIQKMMDVYHKRYDGVRKILTDYKGFLIDYCGSQEEYDLHFIFPELLQVPETMRGRTREPVVVSRYDNETGRYTSLEIGRYQINDISIGKHMVMSLCNIKQELYYIPLEESLRCITGAGEDMQIRSGADFECRYGKMSLRLCTKKKGGKSYEEQAGPLHGDGCR